MPSGDTVTYRSTVAAVLRIETPGQGDATERRESFALPPDTTASIEVDDASRPQVVTLVISPLAEVELHGTLPPRRQRSTRLEAVVARDLRFMTPREKADPTKGEETAEKPSDSSGKEEPAGEKTNE